MTVPIGEYIRVVRLLQKNTKREGLSLIVFSLALLLVAQLIPSYFRYMVYAPVIPTALLGLLWLVWARLDSRRERLPERPKDAKGRWPSEHHP